MSFHRSKSKRHTSLRKIVIYALLLLTTTAEAQFRLDPYSITEIKAAFDLEKNHFSLKGKTSRK